MLYIVSTDLRIRLAQAPFESKLRPFLDRIELRPYAELLGSGLNLDATFLLCSVSCFSPWQREAASLWASCLSASHPAARIVNRPDAVPSWEDSMAALRAQGHRVSETWSLAEQLANPRFPIVFRQYSPEFQLESPVIEDSKAIPEIVDRMVMAGGAPERIRAIDAGALAARNARIRWASLLRLGDRFFPSGDWSALDGIEQVRTILEPLAHEAAAFDFFIDEQGPCLWRIDDELCRILPDLAGPGLERPKFALEEALLALDRSPGTNRRGEVQIDGNSLKRLSGASVGSA